MSVPVLQQRAPRSAFRAAIIPLALGIACAGTVPGPAIHAAPLEHAPGCVDSAGLTNTLDAYFAALSGPQGERDWTALRAATLDTARFDPIGIDQAGQNRYYPQSREEFLAHIDAYARTTGFFQRPVDPEFRCWRRVAQVWTRFESRNAADGPVIDRGRMGLHLVHDGTRWSIAHVQWNSEPHIGD